LIPNGQTIEVAVTFFSEAVHAADLMGIPKEMTFGVMIPIGWPQNDFVKAKRKPISEVIHWDSGAIDRCRQSGFRNGMFRL
jgi:hypothetical protein